MTYVRLVSTEKHGSNRMKITLLLVTWASLCPLLTGYIPYTPDLEIPKEWEGNGLLRAHTQGHTLNVFGLAFMGFFLGGGGCC